jgi:hypothetical protein
MGTMMTKGDDENTVEEDTSPLVLGNAETSKKLHRLMMHSVRAADLKSTKQARFGQDERNGVSAAQIIQQRQLHRVQRRHPPQFLQPPSAQALLNCNYTIPLIN